MVKKFGYALFGLGVVALFAGVSYGVFLAAKFAGLGNAAAVGSVVGFYALFGKIAEHHKGGN